MSIYAFWRRNKYAITLGSLNFANTLVNSYWIFTDTPLAGQTISDPASKTFYLLFTLLLNTGVASVAGHGIDRILESKENPATPLLAPK